MNGLFEGLPWKLSALGALVVLITSFTVGLDPWIALERSCVGFVFFWLVGVIGRRTFMHSDHSGAATENKAQAQSAEQRHSE